MGSRMMCVCLTVSSRELVLISAGSDEETSALHELLTAWFGETKMPHFLFHFFFQGPILCWKGD